MSDDEGEPAPLSDLAASVDERRERAAEDRFAEPGFEDVEVGDIWDGEEPPSDDAPPVDAAEAIQVDATETAGARTHVVPKRSYCESCPHFATPPAVHCNHEGTEILAFADKDHVRVRDCPVVAVRDPVEDGPPG